MGTKHNRTPEELEIDFWSRVDIGEPYECWEWKSRRFRTGYGQIYRHGRHLQAHRVSYTLKNGDIPDGLCVLHKCDNPSCVNPTHLFLGTFADNAKDRDEKGHGFRGEKHGMSKLSEIQVKDMRSKYDSGDFCVRELAAMFGVCQTTAYYAIHGINWKHIPIGSSSCQMRQPGD